MKKNFILMILILVVLTGIAGSQSSPIYSKFLNITASENKTVQIILDNTESITSLSINGSYYEGTKGLASIEYLNESYVIVAINSSPNIDSCQSYTETGASNGSKNIGIEIAYGNDENYDVDNDGISNSQGIIDITAKNTSFDWSVNYDYVCTRWNINNNFICYGSEECCNVVSLDSQGIWNDSLYVNYGLYGLPSHSKILGQVIYANYSLNISNPYQDVHYSNFGCVDVKFENVSIPYESVCTDTCSVNFDTNVYPLDLKVEEGQLHVDYLVYNLQEDAPRSLLSHADSCTANITLHSLTTSPKCGNNIIIGLNDTAPGCDAGTCWGGYTKANLTLPTNLTVVLPDTLNQTLDPFVPNDGSWTIQCNSTGNYTINITLDDQSGNTCGAHVTINITSWFTNPNLLVNFSNIPNNRKIGNSILLNVTLNNTGTDNATEIRGVITYNATAVNITNSTITGFNVTNGTSYNHQIRLTFLAGGDTSLTIAQVNYSRSNGDAVTPVSTVTSNQFHINYNPVLTFPNITLLVNTSDTLKLDANYSDQDTYDTNATVNWTVSANNSVSVTLNKTGRTLNFTANATWTGMENITIQARDTRNATTNQTIRVFVYNSTSEQCNNLDDNGDTRIDEGLTSTTSACSQEGICAGATHTCTAGAWSDCSILPQTEICDDKDNDCDGQKDEGCGGGRSSGENNDGSSTTQAEPETNQEPPKPEETKVPEAQESSDVIPPPIIKQENIEEKIVDNSYRYSRDILVYDGVTQVTEKIQSIGIFDLEDVEITIEIPKSIEDKASDIIEIDPFTILDDDPKISFDLGKIASLKGKEIQYALKKELTPEETNQIIAAIVAKQPDKEQQERELRRLISETSQFVNLTQDITAKGNETEFRIHIKKNQGVTIGDVYIYTEIPKCLIDIIKEELIDSDYDFNIVAEDPLIVWHFDSILDVDEITYSIKAVASEDCTDQAKSIAVAKKIVQLNFSPQKSKILLALLPIPFVILIMALFGLFSKEIVHYDPKVRKLIAYAKHHYKHGFKEHHIREKLEQEGYSKAEIHEALKLNAKNRLHYWMQRLEIGFEEFILVTLIVLDVLDFTEILPGDADYIKKIISWTVLSFVLFHVSITKVILGRRQRIVDIALIVSFFLLILKDMVGFANAAFIEIQGTFVTDLYAYIIQHNQLFEVQFFLVGIILLTIISIYLAINEEVFSPSFLAIIHFHPSKSKNLFKILGRAIMTNLTLLAFFIIIFNLMMEWLAIAVDALIIVMTILFIIFLLIKHKERITPPKLMYDITESSEKFYEKFINLFHYKKTILLGISGMLILHILTELGNFLVPYITGIHDAIYFGNFYEGHYPLFNIIPSETKSLFQMQAAALPLQSQIVIAAGMILNIIAVLYLILLPTFIWLHMFKHRKLALMQIPQLNLNKFHIFMGTVSILFFLMRPSFVFASLRIPGLIGVDIQTQFLNLSDIIPILEFSLFIGISMVLLSLPFRNLPKKIILTTTLAFFSYYIYLFFSTTVIYYLTTIQEWISTTISIYLAVFLAINVLFYTIGMCAFFIELYVRRELWFENHRIVPIDFWIKHHHLPHIHHYTSHKEHIHGGESEFLRIYLEDSLLEGHIPLHMAEHLLAHGWPEDVIKEVSKKTKYGKEIKQLHYFHTHRAEIQSVEKIMHEFPHLQPEQLHEAALKAGYAKREAELALLSIITKH